MKTVFAILTIVTASLLSGCVVYDEPHRDGGYRGDHEGRQGQSEHDLDGGREQQDRQQNEHYRY